MTFARILTVASAASVAFCAYFAATADGIGWKFYFVLLGAINARDAVRSARWWSR